MRGLFARRFQAGERIDGRYRVIRFVAAGGMGDVYEVEDETIGMRLALKTLQSDLAEDDEQRARFKREIHLAAQVTHPNVCRIFGAGIHRPAPEEGPPQPYLTMEYLDGPTLQERLAEQERFDPPEALAIARQVAAGLDAAHAAGIMHRDLKTANVMLVDEGRTGDLPGERVVVTDFGLARALGAEAEEHFLTVDEGSGVLGSGMVGTAAFMAPEQVEGGELSERTDVYAFGVVLFQMVTGQLPFDVQGLLPAAIARLRQAPRRARAVTPELPRRWERVIARCLERDPRDRYASAGDVVNDLESRTRPILPSRRRRLRLALLGVVAVALAALLAARYLRTDWRPADDGGETKAAVEPLEVGDPLQLTYDEGLEIDPSFSPAGDAFVYAGERDGRFELRIHPLAAGERERILPTAGEQPMQPAWSPDGRRVVYVSQDPPGLRLLDLALLDLDAAPDAPPADGSADRPLVGFGSRPAWSPDGRRIVFQSESRTEVAERSLPALPPSALWTSDLEDPATPRRLTESGEPPGGHGEPAWSPDGRWIAFSAGDRRRTAIWRVPAAGGEPQVLAERSRVNLHPRWSPAGDALYWLGIAEGFDRRAAAYAVWRIGLGDDGEPVGEPRQVIRLALATLRQFDLSPDGSALVYGALNTFSQLHSLPISPTHLAAPSIPGPSVALTSGRLRHSRPAFSPGGGRLAFDRWRVGSNLDIWVLDLPPDPLATPAGPPRQLTLAGEWDSQATWLPGGGRIAFFSEREGRRGLWTVELESGENRFLADVGPEADWARLSPGGRHVAYHSREKSASLDVWLHDVETGAERRLTEDPHMAAFPIWSPAGGALAIEVRRSGHTQIALLELEDPENGEMPIPGALRVLTDDAGESWPYSFSPDGRRIAFAARRDGFWNLRWVDVETKEQGALTDQRFLAGYLRYPAWSPRGDRIVYERARTVGDLWRVELRAPSPGVVERRRE